MCDAFYSSINDLFNNSRTPKEKERRKKEKRRQIRHIYHCSFPYPKPVQNPIPYIMPETPTMPIIFPSSTSLDQRKQQSPQQRKRNTQLCTYSFIHSYLSSSRVFLLVEFHSLNLPHSVTSVFPRGASLGLLRAPQHPLHIPTAPPPLPLSSSSHSDNTDT